MTANEPLFNARTTTDAMIAMRARGESWVAIGRMFDVSAQGAQQRVKRAMLAAGRDRPLLDRWCQAQIRPAMVGKAWEIE